MRENVKVSIPPSLTKRLQDCRTANEATKEIANAVRQIGWAIDRVCLRRVDLDEGTVEFVGVWSRMGTGLAPGTVIPIQATSLEDVVRAGGPIMCCAEPFPPLLDHILEQEGIRSWVTIPMWREGAPAALLSLSSTSPNAFRRADISFFEELGFALSDTLVLRTRPIDPPTSQSWTSRRGRNADGGQ